MPGSADYSVKERLPDGRELEIRALRPADQAEMLAAIGRTGAQSLQRRFFVAKRGFSDQEIAFFMNIDFIDHVALVDLVVENERRTIAGGGRYVIVQPGRPRWHSSLLMAIRGSASARPWPVIWPSLPADR